ncbi:DUF1634 domain-containing protein [Geomonas oryzisoli]|uniref:DUF1634 domain-containing protein n=1 Tax=Geomonas oryzisoli TaxID=2847992 RepID=A0ABX8J2G7_9BACT|nr:DUF1634 domain-containing protein [Geomonas oryzisoli]QWV92435.1 DUF1634 domain-containing protein [Geomonas oryzisoli]
MVVAIEPEEKAEHPIELVLARLLRLGSLVAAALLAVGIALMVLGHTGLAPKLITAGLLVLLGTPVLRVVAAAVIFVKERDWHFALFSFVVLCAVAAGIYFGKGM